MVAYDRIKVLRMSKLLGAIILERMDTKPIRRVFRWTNLYIWRNSRRSDLYLPRLL